MRGKERAEEKDNCTLATMLDAPLTVHPSHPPIWFRHLIYSASSMLLIISMVLKNTVK